MVRVKTSKRLRSQEQSFAEQTKKNTPARNGAQKINKLKMSLIIVTGLLFLLFVGFALGINQWLVKYIECGEAPVIVTSSLAGASSEKIYPDDDDYASHFFDSYIDFFDSYECSTPEEKTGRK